MNRRDFIRALTLGAPAAVLGIAAAPESARSWAGADVASKMDTMYLVHCYWNANRRWMRGDEILNHRGRIRIVRHPAQPNPASPAS
jgi:hypothetical protein